MDCVVVVVLCLFCFCVNVITLLRPLRVVLLWSCDQDIISEGLITSCGQKVSSLLVA